MLKGPINRLLSFLSGFSRPAPLELMTESQVTDYLLVGHQYMSYCEEGKRHMFSGSAEYSRYGSSPTMLEQGLRLLQGPPRGARWGREIRALLLSIPIPHQDH